MGAEEGPPLKRFELERGLVAASFGELKARLSSMQQKVATDPLTHLGAYFIEMEGLDGMSVNGTRATEIPAVRTVLAAHGQRIRNDPKWQDIRHALRENLMRLYHTWETPLDRAQRDATDYEIRAQMRTLKRLGLDQALVEPDDDTAYRDAYAQLQTISDLPVALPPKPPAGESTAEPKPSVPYEQDRDGVYLLTNLPSQGKERLGDGMSATVLLYDLPGLGEVAIKFPKGHLGAQDLRDQEQILRTLNRRKPPIPGVPRLIGVGEFGGLPILGVEVIRGETFAEKTEFGYQINNQSYLALDGTKTLDGKPLDEMARKRAQFCWGLLEDVVAPCHEASIIISDQKYEDAILTTELTQGTPSRRVVKYLDFGNAKEGHSRAWDTQLSLDFVLKVGFGLPERYVSSLPHRWEDLANWLRNLRSLNPHPAIAKVLYEYASCVSDNVQKLPYENAAELMRDLRPFFIQLGVTGTEQAPASLIALRTAWVEAKLHTHLHPYMSTDTEQLHALDAEQTFLSALIARKQELGIGMPTENHARRERSRVRLALLEQIRNGQNVSELPVEFTSDRFQIEQLLRTNPSAIAEMVLLWQHDARMLEEEQRMGEYLQRNRTRLAIITREREALLAQQQAMLVLDQEQRAPSPSIPEPPPPAPHKKRFGLF